MLLRFPDQLMSMTILPMTFFHRQSPRFLPITALLLLSTHINFARADSACHYIEQADLALNHADPARQPTVAGAINAKPVNLEISTGSTHTFILRAEADRQNLHPERIQRQMQSASGAESVFLVRVKDFAVGAAHVTNLRFPVIEAIGNTAAAGVLGADFLHQYDMDLNFAERQVKLFQADHCKDKALAYWNQEALRVPLAFTSQGYRPLVQVKLNGITVNALISTSSRYSTVDVDTARRLGLSTDAPGVVYRGKTAGIGEEKLDRWNMTFDSFAIGDEVVQHPRLVVVESTYRQRGRKEYDMVLGRDFLSAHRVLLAQSQMQVYYTYNGGQVFLKDEIDSVRLPQAAP
jgi:predicted aspartyl protease